MKTIQRVIAVLFATLIGGCANPTIDAALRIAIGAPPRSEATSPAPMESPDPEAATSKPKNEPPPPFPVAQTLVKPPRFATQEEVQADLEAAANRRSAIMRKPSAELQRYMKYIESLTLIHHTAFLARICPIRSEIWFLQIDGAVRASAINQRDKFRLTADELSVAEDHADAIRKKTAEQYHSTREGCLKLANSSDLKRADEFRQRATLNYH